MLRRSVFDVICGDLNVTPGIGFDLAEKGFEGFRKLGSKGVASWHAGNIILLADVAFLQFVNQAFDVADLQSVFFTDVHEWSPLLF